MLQIPQILHPHSSLPENTPVAHPNENKDHSSGQDDSQNNSNDDLRNQATKDRDAKELPRCKYISPNEKSYHFVYPIVRRNIQWTIEDFFPKKDSKQTTEEKKLLELSQPLMGNDRDPLHYQFELRELSRKLRELPFSPLVSLYIETINNLIQFHQAIFTKEEQENQQSPYTHYPESLFRARPPYFYFPPPPMHFPLDPYFHSMPMHTPPPYPYFQNSSLMYPPHLDSYSQPPLSMFTPSEDPATISEPTHSEKEQKNKRKKSQKRKPYFELIEINDSSSTNEDAPQDSITNSMGQRKSSRARKSIPNRKAVDPQELANIEKLNQRKRKKPKNSHSNSITPTIPLSPWQQPPDSITDNGNYIYTIPPLSNQGSNTQNQEQSLAQNPIWLQQANTYYSPTFFHFQPAGTFSNSENRQPTPVFPSKLQPQFN